MDTKTWAMTTAVVVKEICTPRASRVDPSMLRLPSVDSRAMPATTGGMVMGSTVRTRPMRTPGHWRERRRARGTPRTTLIAVAIRQVRSDRPSARVAASDISRVGSSVQDTRVPNPTKGSTIAQAPRSARASTGAGRRVRAARERRRGRERPVREGPPAAVEGEETRSVTVRSLACHAGRCPREREREAGPRRGAGEEPQSRQSRGRGRMRLQPARGQPLSVPDSACADSVGSVDSASAGVSDSADSADSASAGVSDSAGSADSASAGVSDADPAGAPKL